LVTPISERNSYQKAAQNYELNFMQSWEWGEIKKPNWQPIRVLVDDFPVTILTKKLFLIRQKFGYIPRALSSGKFTKDQFSLLLGYLEEQGLSHIILEPDTSNIEMENTLRQEGWRVSGHTIQPQNTNIVSLVEGEEVVFARMSGNYRKKIRRAVKHGCEIEVLSYEKNSDAIERFYKIMDEIYHRTKFVMYGKEYFEKIWNTFGPLENAKILIVKYKGIDVGAIMYLYNKNVAYELYGGTGQSGRSIMANYLLKWEGIKLAIEIGKKSYDQWGVAPKVDGVYDSKHPLAKISQFKSGFGGEDVEYLPQFVKVFNPLAYRYYKLGLLANRLKLIIKKV
jgi:peptidoglycan pentaglycine glycine transferase (the first glycine)